MLGMGLNRSLLPSLTDEMMKTVCGMHNPIHRLKLRQALQGKIWNMIYQTTDPVRILMIILADQMTIKLIKYYFMELQKL